AFLAATMSASPAQSTLVEAVKIAAPGLGAGLPGTPTSPSAAMAGAAAGLSLAAPSLAPTTLLLEAFRPAAAPMRRITAERAGLKAQNTPLALLTELCAAQGQDHTAGELKAAALFTGEAERRAKAGDVVEDAGVAPGPKSGLLSRSRAALHATVFLAASAVSGVAAAPDEWTETYRSPVAGDMAKTLSGFLHVAGAGLALAVAYIVYRGVRTMLDQKAERARSEQRLALKAHKVASELAVGTGFVVKPIVLEETERVLRPENVLKVGPGQAIIEVGQVAKSIYKVKKGRVVVLSATGDVIGGHGEGEFFGIYAFLGGGTIRSARVVAAEDAEIEEFSKADFLAYLDAHPEDRVLVYDAARRSMLGNVSAFPQNPASAQALGPQSSEAERRNLFVHLLADLEDRFQSKDAVYVVVHIINMLAYKAKQMPSLAGARLGGVQANLGADNKLVAEMEAGFLFEKTLQQAKGVKAADVAFLMAPALSAGMTLEKAQALAASLSESGVLYVSGPDDKGVRKSFEQLGFSSQLLIDAPSGLLLLRLTPPKAKKK
ncbi:MAG: Crp/Fnr family transcriptional regulator, partial [Elusimicrobia bacterium]|nr:Crp/Fnr family transcriptional regulator [Elusimicrobiota bacterium]